VCEIRIVEVIMRLLGSLFGRLLKGVEVVVTAIFVSDIYLMWEEEETYV
jgi:uncharacterized membrane protein required for colicin V production